MARMSYENTMMRVPLTWDPAVIEVGSRLKVLDTSQELWGIEGLLYSNEGCYEKNHIDCNLTKQNGSSEN